MTNNSDLHKRTVTKETTRLIHTVINSYQMALNTLMMVTDLPWIDIPFTARQHKVAICGHPKIHKALTKVASPWYTYQLQYTKVNPGDKYTKVRISIREKKHDRYYS